MMKKITRRSFLTVCGAVAAAAALSACGRPLRAMMPARRCAAFRSRISIDTSLP